MPSGDVLGFGVSGFQGLGFRVSGFQGFGFRVAGFFGFRVSGFRVKVVVGSLIAFKAY